MSISIKYGTDKIAQASEACSIVLPTKGTFCKESIFIGTNNYHTYDVNITDENTGGWHFLTDLTSDVMKYINDPSLKVTLIQVDDYHYRWYSTAICTAGNLPRGVHSLNSDFSIYGMSLREQSETSVSAGPVYYPANNTVSSTNHAFTANNKDYWSYGAFRLSGNQYYFRAADGYFKAGKYRLTFTWRENKNVLDEKIYDYNGTELFETDPFKRDFQASDNMTTYGSIFYKNPGTTSTGLIKFEPCYTASDINSIYIYGLDFNGLYSEKVVYYASNFSCLDIDRYLEPGCTFKNDRGISFDKLGEHYYRFKLKFIHDSNAKYMAISGSTVEGLDPIITINEPCF